VQDSGAGSDQRADRNDCDDDGAGIGISAAAAARQRTATGSRRAGRYSLALRLKVVDRKITEVEHVIARIDAPSQLNALKTPRAAFFQVVPKARRDARNILLLIGNSYYDALTQNNGELAPFADDCGRRENGM